MKSKKKLKLAKLELLVADLLLNHREHLGEELVAKLEVGLGIAPKGVSEQPLAAPAAPEAALLPAPALGCE